jgi:tetratricopeptide (TPR) repeat protein
MRVLGASHFDTAFTTWRLVAGLQSVGRTSEAIDICNEVAAQIDQSNSNACYMLASAYAEAGDHQSAVKWLQKTADSNPDDARAASVVAREQLSAGDSSGYREACTRMVAHFSHGDDQRQFWVAWTCGLAPGALADLSGPIEQARALVAKDPHNADRLMALGMLLLRSEKYAEAKNWLSAAATMYTDAGPEGSIAHTEFLLATLRSRMGRTEEAGRSLTKALELQKEKTTSMADWNRRATIRLFR